MRYGKISTAIQMDVTSSIAVSAPPPPPLPPATELESEDFSGGIPLGWSTAASWLGAEWFADTSNYFNAPGSVRAGAIPDSGKITEYSNLFHSVTCGVNGGYVTFAWTTDSEQDYDFLTFYIDDVMVDSISGAPGWLTVTASLTPGPHDLLWSYTKDTSVSIGADTGWIDDFHFGEFDSMPSSATSGVTVAGPMSVTGSFLQGQLVAAPGVKSHAQGDSTTASGDYSHAEGKNTTASGDYSHAEGQYTNASGDYSHAAGGFSAASGLFSHAEGLSTNASGYGSHAEGSGAASIAYYSHAEGMSTAASGQGAHAEGGQTTASGYAAHSEGHYVSAAANYSHAAGAFSAASGQYSHAEGVSTTASGYASHAEGVSTTASGYYSHAEGYGTVADGIYQHVEGKFNNLGNDFSLLVVGDGTSNINRSDILRVNPGASPGAGSVQVTGSFMVTLGLSGSLTKLADGTSYLIAGSNVTITTGSNGAITIDSLAAGGTVWNELSPSPRLNTTASVSIAGDLGSSYAAQSAGSDVFFFVSGSIKGSGSDVKKAVFGGDVRISGSLSQGFSPTASGNSSHAQGNETYASGIDSHAEGSNTAAVAASAHAEGYYTGAASPYSHAEGSGCQTLAYASHAEGWSTYAYGQYSHTEGQGTTTETSTGFAAHAEGYYTTAKGYYTHAEGFRSTAIGQGSHAEGYWSRAVGLYSHAEGNFTIASGSYQHVGGKYNKRDNDFSLFVIGDGTGDADANRSDIFRVDAGAVGGSGVVQVTGSFMTSGPYPILNVQSGTVGAGPVVLLVSASHHLTVFTIGNVTASLPTSAVVGTQLVFKDGTGAASTSPQMVSSSTGLINGSSTYTLPTTNYTAVTVVKVNNSPDTWVTI